MSGFRHLVLALSILSVLAGSLSCSRKVELGPDTIPFVSGLITDSLPALQSLAQMAGQKSGPIVIIGEPHECYSLAQQFDSSDVFDNIDGRQVSDSLPDFAGEKIVALMDYVNAPYDSILALDGGKLLLREVAVRNALAAIDTSVSCKAIILSSTMMAEYGGRDIIDLFQRIGCRVPVFTQEDTTRSIIKECYSFMRKQNMFTHDIRYPQMETLMTVDFDSTALGFATIPCKIPTFAEPVDSLSSEPSQQTTTIE